MSVFGPNQVEELIIGNAVAAETTLATFITSASDQEIKSLSADGSAPAEGVNFKYFQKTAGSASKGLNYEFSDVIEANKVDEVILKSYSAEVQKSVRVEGFDSNVVADTTYAVEIRLYQDGGTLSPENFATITGYYVTGSNVTGVTAANVRDGIVASLNANLTKRGGGEFVITTPNATETDILIAGAPQEVVQGKITGRQIEFDVTAKQFLNSSLTHENLGLLTTTVVSLNNPGVGTGKYALNLEWFTKGYKYEAYRQTGFPADFTERVPQYASAAGVYNVIHIKYKSSRISPTVEDQPKVLTILMDKVTDTLANNAATNAVLADLRTILGTAKVPADLAVV
jgi:hypothetical protein